MQFCIFCSAPAMAIVTVAGTQETLCEQHLVERRRQHDNNLTTYNLVSLASPSTAEVKNVELVAQLQTTFGELKDARAELESSNRALQKMAVELAESQDACERYAVAMHDQRTELELERSKALGGEVAAGFAAKPGATSPPSALERRPWERPELGQRQRAEQCPSEITDAQGQNPKRCELDSGHQGVHLAMGVDGGWSDPAKT